MIRMKLIVLGFLLSASTIQAASIEDVITMCDDCHGKNGVSSDTDIPTIAGFSETTISDMMSAYIDETRPAHKSKYRHGDTARAETDMKTIANELSEEEIEALATHYSEQTFVPAVQEFDESLVKKGAKLHEDRCTKCHEEGGSSPDDDAAILAGQWIPYMQQSFDDYRSGDRETDEEMQKKINKLSEKQIKALIHYYASQQ